MSSIAEIISNNQYFSSKLINSIEEPAYYNIYAVVCNISPPRSLDLMDEGGKSALNLKIVQGLVKMQGQLSC